MSNAKNLLCLSLMCVFVGMSANAQPHRMTASPVNQKSSDDTIRSVFAPLHAIKDDGDDYLYCRGPLEVHQFAGNEALEVFVRPTKRTAKAGTRGSALAPGQCGKKNGPAATPATGFKFYQLLDKGNPAPAFIDAGYTLLLSCTLSSDHIYVVKSDWPGLIGGAHCLPHKSN